MPATYSYNKTEKLKSRKVLAELFTNGKSFSAFPLKVFYVVTDGAHSVKAGVGVSARNFKKAVDRNRIKRLIREAWRLEKNILQEKLKGKNIQLSVFFIYTAKELTDFKTINEKVKMVLNKLINQTGYFKEKN